MKFPALLPYPASVALAAVAFTLAGCMQPYVTGQTTLLSRLPEYQANAVPARPQPLSEAEKRRYAEIDRQVLRQQEAAIAAQQAIWVYHYFPPPVPCYGGWGWNGCWGWNRSWDWDYYYSPGWWYGWWYP